MNSAETRLKDLLPPAFQEPLDPRNPYSACHQFVDISRTYPTIEPLIRGTIRVADFAVGLRSRYQETLICLQAEVARGQANEEGFVTVTKADRYLQTRAEFERVYPKLSVIAHLEQRAEALRREELLRVRNQLWQNSPWQPEIQLHPLVNVESFLNHQFNQLTPSKVGILVDDGDKTGITARIMQALIVNPTNLTRVSANAKEKLEDLAEGNDLRIWGNYWRIERMSGNPNHSYLYQICKGESFRDTLFRMFRANRELQRLRFPSPNKL